MALASGMALAAVPMLGALGTVQAATVGTLHGNLANALLAGSAKGAPASTSAKVTLYIGFNFQNAPTTSPYPQTVEQFIQQSVTPGSHYFHQFMTEPVFASTYAPATAEVDALLNYLQQYSITPVVIGGQAVQYPLGINVTGTVGNIETAFHVSINNYLSQGRSFIANDQNPVLPTNYNGYNLAQLVSGVAGMTSYNGLTDHMVQKANAPQQGGSTTPVGYTPQQMAQIYGVSPLYALKKPITGSGETMAVATLAPFVPTDPSQFWKTYHIARTGSLSEVGVDGQSTTASGKGLGGSETSLDVERSGAMAPGANIVVYEAPNTNPGFLDLFQEVATKDAVNVMTVSWGESDFFTPFSYAYMMNQAFMQGAAEGITMMAASGDYGAYDGYPQDKNLSVDLPASAPDILAVGGTTLPQVSSSNSDPTTTDGVVVIPGGHIAMKGEQGWGWQYLLPYYQNFGLTAEARWKADIYPIGSGGGASSLFTASSPVPTANLYDWWQTQSLNDGARDVPDVAFNADPFTGYAIYDTNSVYTSTNAGWTNGWGGTSFASPQWAGIVALLDQYTGSSQGSSQGLINNALYSNANSSGLRQITQGNNWYYNATSGWNAVTGLGVPDAIKLAQAIAVWQNPSG